MFGVPDPADPDRDLGYLVDLPGYGFASIAKEAQADWAEVLGGYLHTRTSLAGVVLMVDIRRGVTQLDRNLMDWIAPIGTPVLALLTKADKFPYGQRVKAAFAVKKDLANIGALTTVPFSSTHRIGLEEAAAHIEGWLQPAREAPSA